MFKLSQAQKEILKLLPQKAAKLIPVTELIKMGSKVAASAIVGDGYRRDVQNLSIKGLPSGVEVSLEDVSSSAQEVLGIGHGEKILEIYFGQLFADAKPVHLDLRASFFAPRGDYLVWRPSPLRHRFSVEFLESIRQLYQGFYHDDLLAFDRGLEGLGILKPAAPEKERLQVRHLFYEHFGEGRTAAVTFSLPRFQKSFDQIFSYFLEKEIPLHPEFALLGANLVTIYSNLQNIGAALDVRGSFLRAESRAAE
jgi:hypothetical protein